MDRTHRLTIIGIGRLGGALCIELDRSGCEIVELVVRRGLDDTIRDALTSKPQVTLFDNLDGLIDTDIVVICTGDPEIRKAADSIAPFVGPLNIVLHTSGALSSEVLASCVASGAAVGSMHPLVSISRSSLDRSQFEGAYFAIEGTTKANATAAELANRLKAVSFTIPTEKKSLYHAAAVTASGHLTALIDVAGELMRRAGTPNEFAGKMLLPLVRSTIRNIEASGTQRALTGSFARADVETVAAHLKALMECDTESALEIYKALGERSSRLALDNDADPERIREILDLLRHKVEPPCARIEVSNGQQD